MKPLSLASVSLLVLALTGCTVMPTGPSVTVLPGSTKSFEQFRYDDVNCRQYAHMQVGGANEAVNQSAVGSAVVGTAIGALAGAALGGNHEGAAVGAGMGLLMGSSVGAGNAQSAGYGSQRGYDSAYVQLRHDPSQVVRAPDYVNHSTLAGAGLSLVWARPGQYALRISAAKPTQGQAKSDTQERSVRVYAQGSWRF